MKSLSKKILLVEDDSKVCSFINRGLTEEGFEMTVAMTGKQGMEWASSTTFDLLILDIMLPDINGLDICKAVRQNNQHIPILFLTALGSAENIALGLDSGADDYLVKPFKFIELVARIKSLLRRSENFENRFVKEEAIYRFFRSAGQRYDQDRKQEQRRDQPDLNRIQAAIDVPEKPLPRALQNRHPGTCGVSTLI